MPLPPVLALHQSGAFKYELSGLRTGSIRDQVLRGQLLVEALYRLPGFRKTLPLLVVGGGAAGAACALTALKAGGRVTLLEAKGDLFTTQRPVRTRWIDPVEFDWPQPHWTSEILGSPSKGPVLPIKAAWASDLADAWKGPLTIAANTYGAAFDLRRGENGRAWQIESRADGVEAVPSGAALGNVATHCAAISCIGFSGEDTAILSSSGTEILGAKFWAPDDFDQPSLGTGRLGADTDESTRLHALVSGGGDGAMQDFQRIATGLMGRSLYDRLPLAGSELSSVVVQALLAEDAARRAHMWSEPGAILSNAYASWHRAYELLADSIWLAWQPHLAGLCRDVLRPGVTATWIVGGPGATYSYGLNRLLSLLVAKLLAHRSGRTDRGGATPSPGTPVNCPTILYDHRLSTVTSIGHTCSTDCYGKRHTVRLRRHPADAAGTHVDIGPFDLIVARYGVDHTPLFGDAAFTEQVVPFDFPN